MRIVLSVIFTACHPTGRLSRSVMILSISDCIRASFAVSRITSVSAEAGITLSMISVMWADCPDWLGVYAVTFRHWTC